MTFALYADEDMTVPFAEKIGNTQGKNTTFDTKNRQPVQLRAYFGSPNRKIKLQTAKNAGVDAITITPENTLPRWQPETAYSIGDGIEPPTANGFFYVCIGEGTSGTAAPYFIATVGAVISDNGVLWRCVGQRYSPNHVKLALSQNGLNSAPAGGALTLPAVITGGAAVAIHIEIDSAVGDLYDFSQIWQLQLSLNECEVVAV